MKPTRAVVMRPRTGGPDEVHLIFGDLPSPTSSTKQGLIAVFKTFGGTAETYLIRNCGLAPSQIVVNEEEQ